jgi:hypothetical protein
MSTTDPHDELQPDHGWDNRRLILAALAPRETTRPARRGTATAVLEGDTDDHGKTPGLLNRGFHAAGRAARWTGHQFNKRVPPNRRAHTAVITAAAVVVLLVALSGVKYLTTDVTSPTSKTSTAVATPTPPPSREPLNRDTIITGVTAEDVCPRDKNYSAANNALDGNLDTAWRCTRVENKDGQLIQIDFHRQVTLTQIRCDGGFDSVAPDGTDLWSQHHIVTAIEVFWPKDLNRRPTRIDTGGERDFRGVPGGIDPPATVTKLLLRVAETSEPPQSPNATSTTAEPSADDVTTVAISECQFIGKTAGT